MATPDRELQPDWRHYVAEAIGTFALVAVGPGAVMVSASTHAFGHAGVALAFGLVIAFVVAATGHLSGAHINPAVTIAFWSVRRFPASAVVPYIVAQCVGAVTAAFALRWILGPVGALGATAPALSLGRAFAVEFGYSALLAFVIMSVATDERAPAGAAPFALGATVFAGALVTGPLTGGSFNPARSLGPALAGGGWAAHWLYWAAPITGMVVAMHLYERLRPAAAPSVPNDVPLGVEGPIGLRRPAMPCEPNLRGPEKSKSREGLDSEVHFRVYRAAQQIFGSVAHAPHDPKSDSDHRRHANRRRCSAHRRHRRSAALLRKARAREADCSSKLRLSRVRRGQRAGRSLHQARASARVLTHRSRGPGASPRARVGRGCPARA